MFINLVLSHSVISVLCWLVWLFPALGSGLRFINVWGFYVIWDFFISDWNYVFVLLGFKVILVLAECWVINILLVLICAIWKRHVVFIINCLKVLIRFFIEDSLLTTGAYLDRREFLMKVCLVISEFFAWIIFLIGVILFII